MFKSLFAFKKYERGWNNDWQVSVTVLNPSNAGPVFNGNPYSFRVPDNTPTGSAAGQVYAYDFVSNGRANVTYQIVPGGNTTGNGENYIRCSVRHSSLLL